MHVSSSVLEAQHVCTASSMSSTSSGSTRVGGVSSFSYDYNCCFSANISLPFGCRQRSWWLGPSRAIVCPIARRAVSTFPSLHGLPLGVIFPVLTLWANAARWSAMCVELGSQIGLITHSVHFANQMSHHASVFVAVEGTTPAVAASFARQREVQNSSLATGCTVLCWPPSGR